MAGKDNLIPQAHVLTVEEQSAGGRASAEARRRRKTLKEDLLILLEQGDTQEKVTLALLKKAMEGDTKAFEVLRDTIGEKPKDTVEQNVTVSSEQKNAIADITSQMQTLSDDDV